LNAVAAVGLPLPVLQPFRPSAFLQVNEPLTMQCNRNHLMFAQALCADNLHPQFKVHVRMQPPPPPPPPQQQQQQQQQRVT